MRFILPALFTLGLLAQPAAAEPSLERGFDGALRGCEEWLLNPASWVDGPDPFIEAVGLGNQMGLVERVEEANLPPKPMRHAMYYWRINSTPNAGYVLVVSDQIPMCHITGGGGADLQPSVQSVLSSSAFSERWEEQNTIAKSDMNTTTFWSRVDPALSIVITRAERPAQRLDRVQLVATATYQTGN